MATIKNLKRMLKIAVEDIYNRSYCGMCENGIPIDNDVCDRCKAMTLDMFEWRHKAEAMKLIGEEKWVDILMQTNF